MRPGSGLRRELTVIALGGVVGAEARYGLTEVWPSRPGEVPWVVLAINICGGLLMGVLMGWLEQRPHPMTRLFLGVGVLGGFTTFSTYSTDTIHLMDAGRPAAALSYAVLTLAGALLAVVLGRAFWRLATRGRK